MPGPPLWPADRPSVPHDGRVAASGVRAPPRSTRVGKACRRAAGDPLAAGDQPAARPVAQPRAGSDRRALRGYRSAAFRADLVAGDGLGRSGPGRVWATRRPRGSRRSPACTHRRPAGRLLPGRSVADPRVGSDSALIAARRGDDHPARRRRCAGARRPRGGARPDGRAPSASPRPRRGSASSPTCCRGRSGSAT